MRGREPAGEAKEALAREAAPGTSLVRVFRAHAAGTDVSVDDRELDLRLREAYAAGRQSWPTIELAPEAFAEQLAPHATDGAPPRDLRATDFYLTAACARRASGAIEAFEREHLRRVDAYLARMRVSRAFVDDVRQALREKLFVGKDGAAPKIVEYGGKGALTSWMRVIAVRTAIDLQRQRTEIVEPRSSELAGSSPGDPEAAYIKEGYRAAFDEAVRTAVARLAPEQLYILRLHFIDGLTLDEVATKLAIHRATVARRIAVARAAVADHARQELRAKLGASESEVESIIGLMQSHLDVSLKGLLRDAATPA